MNVAEDQHDYRNLTGPERLLDLALVGKLNPIRIGQIKTCFKSYQPFELPDCDCWADKGTDRVALIDDDARSWGRAFALVAFGSTKKAHVVPPFQLPEPSDEVGLFSLETIGDNEENAGAFLGIDATYSEGKPSLIPFNILLLDYRLHREDPKRAPGEVSGYKVLKAVRKCDPSLPVIVVTASTRTWTMTVLKEEGIWFYYLKPMLPDVTGVEEDFRNLEQSDFESFRKAFKKALDARWLRAIQWVRICSIEEAKNPGHNPLLGTLSKRLELVLHMLTSEPRLTIMEETTEHRERAFLGSLFILSVLADEVNFTCSVRMTDSSKDAVLDEIKEIDEYMKKTGEHSPELDDRLKRLSGLLKSFRAEQRMEGRHSSWQKGQAKSLLSAKAVIKDIRNAIAHDTLLFVAHDHSYILLQTLCIARVLFDGAGIDRLQGFPLATSTPEGLCQRGDESIQPFAERLQHWLRLDSIRAKNLVFSKYAKDHPKYGLTADEDLTTDLWNLAEVLLENYHEAREAVLCLHLVLLLSEFRKGSTWLEKSIYECAFDCTSIAMKALDDFCLAHRLPQVTQTS